MRFCSACVLWGPSSIDSPKPLFVRRTCVTLLSNKDGVDLASVVYCNAAFVAEKNGSSKLLFSACGSIVLQCVLSKWHVRDSGASAEGLMY